MNGKMVTITITNPQVCDAICAASPFTSIQNNQAQVDCDVIEELIAHLTGCGYAKDSDYTVAGLGEGDMQNGYDNNDIHGDGHFDTEYFPSGQTDTANNMKGKQVPGINNPHMHAKSLSEEELRIYESLKQRWDAINRDDI